MYELGMFMESVNLQIVIYMFTSADIINIQTPVVWSLIIFSRSKKKEKRKKKSR